MSTLKILEIILYYMNKVFNEKKLILAIKITKR